jgi:predicted permease
MFTPLIEYASRVRAFFRSRRLDADFQEELDSHLALLTEENLRKGMNPPEAARAARLALGNAPRTAEAHREARGLPWLETLLQDLKYAARSLGRTPGFAAAAVLTLGIGIGANTAIFSAIDETLFRPPDFPHPEQLADIFTFNKSTQTWLSASYPDYEDFRARSTVFQQISAFMRMPLNVARNGQSERLPVEAVTGNYFSLLEMAPAAGRLFRNDDDSPAGLRVALLSEEIAAADSLGKQVLIEDQPFTVVGIVSRRYHGLNLNWGESPRVWIPLHATEIVQPRFRTVDIFHHRTMPWLLVTGRLNPGFGVPQAQAEIRAIAESIARSEPQTNRDLSAVVFSAARSKFWPSYRDSISRSLAVFAAAAGLVLLLSCANLSSLLLSRAVGRRREFAVRLSLGAGRGRLVRQLLTESLLLALPSCFAALALAFMLGKVLVHFPNALGLPLALDGGVLAFCIALSISAALLFGLVPALQSTRANVLPALKDAGNGYSGAGHNSLRNVLLVLQIAFTTILLTGGGLFLRSVLSAWSTDLGFHPEGIATATFPIPAPGAEAAARMRRSEAEFVERLRAMPGVQSAAMALQTPLSTGIVRSVIETGGSPATRTVDRQEAGPGYFQTIGTPLLSGREFSVRDDEAAPKVAIVNRSLAALLWPGANPLGRTVRTMKQTFQVVGVAGDSRYGSVWEDPPPYLYTSLTQSTSIGARLIVRTTGNPADWLPVLARQWNEREPHAPLYDFRTGNDLMKTALAPQRMAAWVFGAFGVIAIVLAAVGLYSSVSYAAARRTREMGIRLAIGATPATLIRQILGGFMSVAASGILVGALSAALLARWIAPQVKGMSVYDATTFVLVAALLGAISLCATAIPARRASRIDPQAALRSD